DLQAPDRHSGTASLLQRGYPVRTKSGREAWLEAAMLNRIFRVCALGGILLSGAYPAIAQPAPSEAADRVKERAEAGSEQFRARLDEAAHAMKNNPRLKALSQQQPKHLTPFVPPTTLLFLV